MASPSSSDLSSDPVRTQEVVVELGRRALEVDEVNTLLTEATDAVATTLNLERCGVFERLHGQEAVRLREGTGWDDDVGSTFPVPADVLRAESPRRLDDPAGADETFARSLLVDHGVTSGVLLPIGAEGSQWGVLGAFSRDEREFEEGETTFLQGVANVLASAIENERVRTDLDEMYGRISDAFFSLDAEWRFTYLNEQARELIAPDGRSLAGENIWEAFPSATERAFKPKYERAMAEQETVAFEEYYPAPLDTWFEVRAYPSETGLSVYFRDVTERKERERELERSEQRYRTLARHFPNGLVTLFDEELRYTLAAGQGFDQFDMSREEVEGKTIQEAWGEEAAAEIEPVLKAAIEGETSSVELSWAGREWLVQGVPITDTQDDVFAGMTMAQDITERKEYERALEESERRYRTLIDHFPDGVVALFDDEYRFLAAGGELFAEFETSPEEPIGTTISERYPPELVEEIEPYFAAAIDGEESSFDVELEGRHLKAQTLPVRDEEGNVFSGMVVVQDVTERIEYQRSLQESERRYRTLAEHFPNGLVALFDEEFRYTAAGGELLDQVDTLTEDPVGETIYDRYSEAHVAQIEPYFEAALAGETSSFEVEREGRHLKAYTLPVRDDDGEAFTGMLLVQDVTERKEYQQQLQLRSQRKEVIAELGQRALTIDDLDQLMEMVTRTVSEELDTDCTKVLELLPGGDSMLLRQGLGWQEGLVGEATVPTGDDSQAGYTLASSQPVVVDDLRTESRFSGPDLLHEHDVVSGISVVIGTRDEPWGVFGTHTTDRREFTTDDVNFVRSMANLLAEAIERHSYEAELEATIEQLKESNVRLEQFAYAASHDLQEPLRMVSSYLQLIERRYGDEFDEDGQEFFEFAIDGAERMRDMINALLKYSRVETEGEAFEPIELENAVADVRDDLKLRIEETDATVEAEPLPAVEGDGRQLRQVFQNLLHNALEYSGDEPPRVTISAERRGRWVTVSVHDEGIGIEPDQTDRIFEVFQRLHGPGDHDGTGIGLALCERIVERHGGSIRVESTPGEGSTFFFTLPAARGNNE